MSERNTIAVIAEEVAKAFLPLLDALSSPQAFTSFMLDLGWNFVVIPQPLINLPTPLEDLKDILETGEVDLSNVDAVMSDIRSFIDAVVDIKNQPDDLFPDTVDASQFKSEFPSQLVQFLIVEYLINNHSDWGNLLRTLGVIILEPVDPSGKRPAYLKLEIAWNDFATLLDNPLVIVKNAYRWGASNFKDESVVNNIADLVSSWGVDFKLEKLDSKLHEFLTKDAIQLNPVHEWILKVPFIEDTTSGQETEVGIGLFILPETNTDQPGFSILPYTRGVVAQEYNLTDDLSLVFQGDFDFTSGVGVLVRPNKPIEVLVDIIPSVDSGVAPPTAAGAAIGLIAHSGDVSKTIILGSSQGSRFEVGLISINIGAKLASTGQKNVFTEIELNDARIVIKPASGEADSFLSSLLPGDGFAIDFSLLLGLSTNQGFYFGGSGSLEVSLPAHLQIGPIEITSSILAVKPDDGNISLELGTTIKGDLGPLKVLVENIGLRASLSFPPNNGGNLGPVDLSLKYKPPAGLGLSVDAGSITGGGNLTFYPDKGQYSGWLHLKTQDITFNAFGLLDTRLPGGESGFSFLILIATTFNPPIQLGLGFALRGIGGLVGINRDVKTDVLQAGLRSHTLDHLLFPENPERDAPLIISDLRSVFPPREGSYVFGPLAIITWAELIEAELGLVLHIADSVRLILLGQIKALVPAEKPILKLHLDIVGVLDFNQKLLDIRSTIYDSSVAGYPLSGEAALLLKWGNDPVFVFAIGGLHPDFPPPPGFPKLKRLTLALSDSDNPRLTLKMYLAVTSNTFQVGAEAELSARGGGFTLYGMLKFDALIDLSSFTFTIKFSVKVELRRGSRVFAGIRLKATLTGPGFWRIWGEACISLFFFDVCVDFDKTFGDPVKLIARKLINPFSLLQAAIQLGRNWSAALPAAALRGVTTVPPEDGDQMAPGQKQTFVDPMGVVTLGQNILPLNRKFAKFGEGKVDGPNHYNVKRVTIGDPASGAAPVNFSMAQGLFAPGQFEFLTDAQKLSRHSFEKMDSGVAIGSQAVKFGANCESDVRYKTIILDSPFDRRPAGIYRLAGDNYLAMNETGAAARGPFQKTGDLKFAPPPRLPAFVALIGDEYVVASTNDLSKRNDIIDGPVTKGAAFLVLDDYLAAHPTERGRLQVVPRHELKGGSI